MTMGSIASAAIGFHGNINRLILVSYFCILLDLQNLSIDCIYIEYYR